MKTSFLKAAAARLCVPAIAMLAMGGLAVSSAQAAAVGVTISGTWGTFTTGAGISTLPFDNGTFSFSTTISSLTPTFFNSGETQLPTISGTYTSGGVTHSLDGLAQLILTDPSVWNGQDFGFGIHDVYAAGDFLAIYFNGPQLFSGPTSAPTVGSGSFVGQEAWYGYSAQYLGLGASDYSYAQLSGNAAITVNSAPEPSTSILMMAVLGIVLLRFRSSAAQRGTR